ncbi:MAG: DUF4893 domain-containing protein [Sphingomonas sp.]|nr:DUF4893 domain-containing protein [Sphingomonas sp.]
MLRTLLLAFLAGPALAQPAPAPEPAPGQSWRTVASADDRRRLRDWRDAWTRGLAEARESGHDALIAGEGALLDPDAALADPAPPPGEYACRVIKIGSQSGSLDYVAYPAFRCRIRAEGTSLLFAKLTGSQRPRGRLYADQSTRMIFIGTMQLGDERRAYQYGIDADRDMIGMMQRIGERRWRLAIPSPRFESRIDVIELVPAGRP